MGAFFTNIQVSTDSSGFDRIVAALRGQPAAHELQEADATADAYRTVFVVPPGADGFVSVYDEATESQDTVALDAMGALVSQAAEATAFTVLVHDSDVLCLGLFERGELVARYNSAPDYFKARPTKRPKKWQVGKVGAWAPLLAAGVSVRALDAALSSGERDVEETLAAVGQLIGCHVERVVTGQGYLAQDPARLPPGTITLRLRSHVRPADESVAKGPPRFDVYWPFGGATEALSEGEELQLSFALGNGGGASRGLTITLWGSAIDGGLVEIDHVATLFGSVEGGAELQRHTPTPHRSVDGATILLVELPQQELAAGGPLVGLAAPGLGAHAANIARARSLVQVFVVGRAVRAGQGTLLGGLVPHASREEGQAVGEHRLTVGPKLTTPPR